MRRATSLRALASFLDEKILDGYKLPSAGQGRPHPLSGGMVDVEAMLAACDGDDELAMVALCSYAGLRISEARSITPKLATGGVLTVLGKGYKMRRVPVSPKLAEILAGIEREPGQPYVGLTDDAARGRWRRIAARAGVSSTGTHDGRATLATELLDKTGNLRLVQEVLGHSSVATTQVYTRVTESQIAEAIAL